jgi:hypothetical protein
VGRALLPSGPSEGVVVDVADGVAELDVAKGVGVAEGDDDDIDDKLDGRQGNLLKGIDNKTVSHDTIKRGKRFGDALFSQQAAESSSKKDCKNRATKQTFGPSGFVKALEYKGLKYSTLFYICSPFSNAQETKPVGNCNNIINIAFLDKTNYL